MLDRLEQALWRAARSSSLHPRWSPPSRWSPRRSKRPAQGERPLPPQSPQQTADTCSYCGGTGHGRNAPTRIRRHKCPAFNQDCTNCGKAHHMAKVCRSEPSSSEVQNESAIYHEVCVFTSLDGRPPRELSHHRFNRHLNSWTPHTSKPPSASESPSG